MRVLRKAVACPRGRPTQWQVREMLGGYYHADGHGGLCVPMTHGIPDPPPIPNRLCERRPPRILELETP